MLIRQKEHKSTVDITQVSKKGSILPETTLYRVVHRDCYWRQKNLLYHYHIIVWEIMVK